MENLALNGKTYDWALKWMRIKEFVVYQNLPEATISLRSILVLHPSYLYKLYFVHVHFASVAAIGSHIPTWTLWPVR
jgi:hypothetical protein